MLLARRETPFGPSAWVGLGFALWFGISVGWMTWQAPDWMLSYTIPASELPMVPVHVMFVLLLAVLVLSSHTLGAWLIQRGHTRLAAAFCVACCAIWVSSHIFTLDRYMSVGTFDEYYAGAAVALPESHLVPHMNGVLFTHLLWLVPTVLLVRNSRRLRPT